MSGTGPVRDRPGRPVRWSWLRLSWKRLALVVVGLAGAGIAVKVLFDSSDELLAAADTLTSVSVGWVVVAVVVELASYWVRGAAERVVLGRGSRAAGSVVLGAATLAGDAAAYCLPFGFAASGVVVFGVLRRRGVPGAVASWMFAVSTLIYVGAVAVLTVVAVQIAGSASPVPGLQPITLGLLGGLVAVGGGYALIRRSRVRLRLGAVLRRTRAGVARGLVTRVRGAGRVREWFTQRWRDWTGQLRAVTLPPSAGAAASVLMMISWLLDISVLALAYVALGAQPPWAGLLLAYCAGQIVASVPVTPGGLGVVEGSITLALVAFGGAETITLAAVLLYRLISYWGCIPAGGLAWLALRVTAPATAPAAVGVRVAEPA